MNNYNNATRVEGGRRQEVKQYSNPIERERLLIEKAERDSVTHQARFSLAGIFGGRK